MSYSITFSELPVELPSKSFRGRSREEWAVLANQKLRKTKRELEQLLKKELRDHNTEYIHFILSLDIRNLEVTINFMPVRDVVLRKAIKDAIHNFQLANPAPPRFPETAKLR
jgi:hypothetical protein